MDDTKKHYIPFDFYDFFAYLFPGFIMSIFISTYLLYENPSIFQRIYDKMKIFDLIIIHYIIIIVGAIILIYLLGHIVATVGSLFLERVFHYGIFDLPIFYLLNIDHKPRYFIVITYKYIFLVTNLILFLSIWGDNHTISIFIIFMGCFIIFLMLIRFGIEALSFFDKINYKMHNPGRVMMRIQSILAFVPNIFVDPILHLIRSFVNNNNKFSEEFINNYAIIFKAKFNMEYKKADDENIWLPYYDISNESDVPFSVLKTFHHLSGFSRNISCACFLSSIVLSFLILFFPGKEAYLLKIELIISVALYIVFYLRYLNLNQNYYIKNILRAFSAQNADLIKK